MIEKVVIKDNEKSPIPYLSEIKAFKNNTEFLFKPGVNIIVGENGSGKSTLLKLIARYLLVDKEECSLGMFNSNATALLGLNKKVPEGVDVYADYENNTFKLCHVSEKSNDDALSSSRAFCEFATQMKSSVGECVVIALNSLFKRMFNKDTKLKFDYTKAFKIITGYEKYIKEHSIHEYNEITVLMDEPDRNLDLKNITQIKSILSFHKPQTQLIVVIHNPLLIYTLSKNKTVNFIEMSEGYIKKVKNIIEELLKKE